MCRGKVNSYKRGLRPESVRDPKLVVYHLIMWQRMEENFRRQPLPGWGAARCGRLGPLLAPGRPITEVLASLERVDVGWSCASATRNPTFPQSCDDRGQRTGDDE